jgi:lipopolysaccharide biosynthesis regulator YciM
MQHSPQHRILRSFRAALCFALMLSTPTLSGCAGPIASFIVSTRNHQGDMALANSNFTDAALAYRLALRVAPGDEHARAGLAAVQLQIAAQEYQRSEFDGALAALAIAAKYDPDSVRLAELKVEVEQARVKRAIVVSNFPTYSETGLALRKSYAQLRKESNAIVTTLQRFDYSYDSTELQKAIRQSNLLNTEVAHLTARLVSYQQLVESGSPEKAGQSSLAPAASLLPLP